MKTNLGKKRESGPPTTYEVFAHISTLESKISVFFGEKTGAQTLYLK